MINLKRMEIYRQIWKHFNLKYTVDQICTTIELIEETEIFPGESEYGYEIWQKYTECRMQQLDILKVGF